jgi:hypothetical protein
LTSKRIIAYVQAVPLSISEGIKSFKDISPFNLRMSHSSKVVLDRALKVSTEVVALGHSSILSEAIARGAKEAWALPLCDDPVVQAHSMRDFIVNSDVSIIIVGENLDAPFSGASFCGVLSSIYDLNFSLDSENLWKEGSVILVRDSGKEIFNIDVRRIGDAISQKFDDSQIMGTSRLEKIHRTQTTELGLEQSPREISSIISRRLRRLSS